MLQRTLSIAGLAAAGLLAYLSGSLGQFALSLPRVGVLMLPMRPALLMSSVLVVLFGSYDGATGSRRLRLETALT